MKDWRQQWAVYSVRVSKQTKGSSSLKAPETAVLSRVNRREFIKTSSLAAGVLAFGMPTLVRGQNLNSKLNIACIGIGGKGRSDTDACAGENIVALCDVDTSSEAYETQTRKYPSAKFYKDFRQMLDQMGNQIDAVTVSMPDHMHAIVASVVMKRNKAVFCQKPLTQTIYEALFAEDGPREKARYADGQSGQRRGRSSPRSGDDSGRTHRTSA